MLSFLLELKRGARAALAVAAWAVAVMPQAQATAVSGQGTWENTLQGRYFSADHSHGFDAYYDKDLNITWLADTNYTKTSGYAGAYNSDGWLQWDAAQGWAANLNVNGITGWRLPNALPVATYFNYNYSVAGTTDDGYNITSTKSELAHLFYVTLGNKARYDTSGQSQGGFGWSNTGPFENVQSGYYWSGTEAWPIFQPNTHYAWSFSGGDGLQDYNDKSYNLWVWAVHPGDVGVAAAAPEPQTWALMLAGVVTVITLARKRRV